MSETMKIVIPMAGYGSRMRPHTWSKPKPLVQLAGKTVLDYVLAQFDSLSENFEKEFVLIISPHQEVMVRDYLKKHYADLKTEIVIQAEMLGQSHALYQAKEHLKGPMMMCFSDTLVEVDLSKLADESGDGIAWVKPVEDPRRFGVAVVNGEGQVTGLVEKPEDVSNNLVVVGFYYFKSGEALIEAIEKQMKQNIALKNEYYLADAINLLLDGGASFRTEEVAVWLDAGKPDALLETNRYFLGHGHDNTAEAKKRAGVAIVEPVFISPEAVVEASVVGPFVSVGKNCHLKGVVVSNSIIEDNTTIEQMVLEESWIGRDVQMSGKAENINVGDNSWVKK